MGAKASTETRVRGYDGQGNTTAIAGSGPHSVVAVGGSGHHGGRSRTRTRSLGTTVHRGHPILFTTTAASGSPDSDESTPENRPRSRSVVGAALPLHWLSFHGRFRMQLYNCDVCLAYCDYCKLLVN